MALASPQPRSSALAIVLFTLAVSAGLAVPLALLFVPGFAVWMHGLGTAAWLSLALILPLLALRRQAWTALLIGCALALFATQRAEALGRTRAAAIEPRAAESHDLRDAPLPADLGPWVHVRGYLYLDQRLDEYRVAHGQRPDQTQKPPALLVPLVGFDPSSLPTSPAPDDNALAQDADPTQVAGALPSNLAAATPELELHNLQARPTTPELRVGPDDRLVIARVPTSPEPNSGLVTYFGRLEPVAPDIVAALIDLSGAQPDSAPTPPTTPGDQGSPTAQHAYPHALLLDTTASPPLPANPREQALTLLLAALATVALGFGVAQRRP